MIKENSKTSYGKSSGKYDTTADFLTNIENRNGKFYTDKATIDKIGQVEARGEDFSPLNKGIMSSVHLLKEELLLYIYIVMN